MALMQGCATTGSTTASTFIPATIDNDHPECLAAMQELADHYSPMASSVAGTYIHPTVVLTTTYKNLDGVSDSRAHTIFINPRICARGITAGTEYLVIHELSHMVAHKRYPYIEKDAYLVNSKYSHAVHDGMADEFAGTISRIVGNYSAISAHLNRYCDPNEVSNFSGGRPTSKCDAFSRFTQI
jgi:hypothetical protein